MVTAASSEPGRQFKNPPSTCRVMAFWSLNGDLTADGIDRWLESFAGQGMGGAFMHPRPGLVTEYLSDQWFHLWAHALATAKRLGIHLQIYDENSYPSGFGGGHVASRDPVTVAGHVTLLPVCSAAQLSQTRATAFLEVVQGAARRINREEAEERIRASGTVTAIVPVRSHPRAFTAGYGYVDLTLPETTARFLESTHAEYWERFKDDFGSTIEYAFTDEPNPEHGDGFAMNDYLLAEFRDEHGYNLEESWADLWFGSGAVRYDYFLTLNRLFLNNFLDPVDRWCRERGIGFTGHFWEHSWPSPRKQPNNMAAMARMAVPGNDLLEFQIERPDFWPKAVLNLKELSSVASQTGATRTVVENGGAGGYDVGLWNFRRTDNTLLSFGVTGYAAHLSHYSLAGTRKYEWPQTLGEPASWWKHYRLHGDHVARVVTLLAESREENRVALIEPTRSGWVLYAPPSLAAAAPDLASERDRALKQLEERFTRLVLDLFERGIGFDLLDEDAIAEARVAGGTLVVGERSYASVGVADCTATLAAATVSKLVEFGQAGGAVIVSGGAPAVDARPGSRADKLMETAIGVFSDTELAGRIAQTHPSLHLLQRVSRGASWHRRVFEDGSLLYIFANSTDEPVSFEWRPERSQVIELDTDAGCGYADDSVSGDRDHRKTRVSARGLAAFLATERSPQDLGVELGESTDRATRLRVVTGHSTVANPSPTRIESVERLEPNVLVIDYCALARAGERHADIHVSAADTLLWRWAGCSGNAWDRAIQFRRNTLERPYRNVSPRVTYTFSVDAGADADLARGAGLVVERADLWQVRVNGNPVGPERWKRWRVEEFLVAEVSTMIHAGANTVELSAEQFDPRMEISPVMLLGEFAVMSADRGFSVAALSPLGNEDVAWSGAPFYPGELEYTVRLPQSSAARTLRVPFAGAYAEVSTSRNESVIALESPAIVTLPERHDSDTITIRIGASAQNIFGPFHSDGLALSSTWANSPASQPAGEAYRFSPHGLTGSITTGTEAPIS